MAVNTRKIMKSKVNIHVASLIESKPKDRNFVFKQRRNNKTCHQNRTQEGNEKINRNTVQKFTRSNHLSILKENQNIVNQEQKTKKNFKNETTNNNEDTKFSQNSILEHQNNVNKPNNCIQNINVTLGRSCEYKSTKENAEISIKTKIHKTIVPNKYLPTLNENGGFHNLSQKIQNKLSHSIKQDVPIYRTKFLEEESQKNTSNVDLYEFNEDIPIIEKVTKQHFKESLKVLEVPEIDKSKESKIPIQNNGPKKKSYNNIVDGIVQNVMGKIFNRGSSTNKKNTVMADNPVNVDNSVCDNSSKLVNTSVGVDLHTKSLERNADGFSSLGSPWRINWVASKPIFISVKSNALPRINQEMVLDHTLVENFEESCIKNGVETKKSPTRKPLIQQSILSYIDSNQTQEDRPLEMSLFDSEMFNSPIKNSKKNIIVASTPVDNISEDTSGDFRTNLIKRALFDSDLDKLKEDEVVVKTADPVQTPLKSYAAKTRNVKYKRREIRGIPLNDEDDVLMSPKLCKKRKASFDGDTGKVCKKFKESKLEVEQNLWIEKFNQECEDISSYDLDIE